MNDEAFMQSWSQMAKSSGKAGQVRGDNCTVAVARDNAVSKTERVAVSWPRRRAGAAALRGVPWRRTGAWRATRRRAQKRSHPMRRAPLPTTTATGR